MHAKLVHYGEDVQYAASTAAMNAPAAERPPAHNLARASMPLPNQPPAVRRARARQSAAGRAPYHTCLAY